jgi:hypothetical protein
LNLIRVMPAKGQDNSMATSVLIARLMGPVLLALGAGLLVNPTCYRVVADEVLRSHALMVFAGIITLPAGLAVVLTHNVWTPDWRVVITLVGWLMVASGALRIIAPRQTAAWAASRVKSPSILPAAGVLWLAVGALLCFFGYLRY